MVTRSRRTKLVLATTTLLGLIALVAAVYWQQRGKPPGRSESRTMSSGPPQRTERQPRIGAGQLRSEALAAIEAASTAETLQPHLRAVDPAVRREAIRRLGEIGGDRAVPMLAEAFRREKRVRGTDVGAGLHGEAVRAIARTGTAAARAELVRLIDKWLQEGPSEQGLYPHIYDTQYFAVFKAALESLEAFADEDTRSLLERIRDDESLFYSPREVAGRVLLKREMSGRGISEPAARASYLLDRIDPGGVPVEGRWTGRKPGAKTSAAVRQSVIESLVEEIGWPAAAPLETILAASRLGDWRRTLGAAGMLADLSLRELGQPRAAAPEPRHREAVRAATSALAGLSRDALASETASRVFGRLQAAAELIRDEETWVGLRRLSGGIRAPNAWQGPAPAAAELAVELPVALTFIPECSRRVATPHGVFLDAWFFTAAEAPDVVARLEKTTGKSASRRDGRFDRPGTKTVHEIELRPGPGKLAQLMASVVSVLEGAGEFERRVLGRSLPSGRTLVRVRGLVRGASAGSRSDTSALAGGGPWRQAGWALPRLASIEPVAYLRASLPFAGSGNGPRARSAEAAGDRDPKDRWVKAAFCGSINIERTIDADLHDRGNHVRRVENARLFAQITGYRKVVNDRTGRAFTIINEGTTRANLTYTETWSMKDVQLKTEMQAQGQEQEPSPPSNKGWVELLVNEARGRYRLRLPSSDMQGQLNTTDIAGGRTLRESRRTWARIHMEWEKSGDRERTYDPASGVIADSYSATMYDLAHREPADRLSWTPYPSALGHPVSLRANWNLSLTDSGCARAVRLVAPSNDEQFVFHETFGPQLDIPATADADPPTYNPTIFPWHIDPIDGSQLQVLEVVGKTEMVLEDRPHGPRVQFHFDGLPTDNNQLGAKTISVDMAEPVRVKVFFEKDSTGNPEGQAKNWFYYWKQGAVPQLDQCKYGGPGDGASRGDFSRGSGITIYDPASDQSDARTIVLYARDPATGGLSVFRTIDVPALEGVDLCHSVVLHELEHLRLSDMFDAEIAGGGTLDSDGDGLPDYAENALWDNYRFDPFEPDTHGIRVQVHMDYWEYGDNELLAREAGLNHAAVHSLDWACPGKQCRK
jgi:hypothetical protein